VGVVGPDGNGYVRDPDTGEIVLFDSLRAGQIRAKLIENKLKELELQDKSERNVIGMKKRKETLAGKKALKKFRRTVIGGEKE
jgi:hypothetical protein